MFTWQIAATLASVSGVFWLLWQGHGGDASKPTSGDCQQGSSHHNSSSSPQRQRKQQHRSATTTASNGNGSADVSIPQHELKSLQAFLRKVYSWRGWQGGPYHVTQAWHAVEVAAMTAVGGGWQQQFTGKQLTDANCDALLAVIDAQFCGAKLLKRLHGSRRRHADAPSSVDGSRNGAVSALQEVVGEEHAGCVECCEPGSRHSSTCLLHEAAVEPSGHASSCSPDNVPEAPPGAARSGGPVGTDGTHKVHRHGGNSNSSAAISASSGSNKGCTGKLRCRVVQNYTDGWLAYFDTQDNVIYINCWRWAKDVSAAAPINCEGVVCVHRLQLLMHTLGHELVHAVVFHLFPDMDSSSPAYTANNRHGPIFHLLNKQLFGHSSDALEHVHLLPNRHRSWGL